MSMFSWLPGYKKPEGSVDDNAIDEARLLERDILNRELELIEKEYKIKAQRAKQEHIIAWLKRPKPKCLNDKTDTAPCKPGE